MTSARGPKAIIPAEEMCRLVHYDAECATLFWRERYPEQFKGGAVTDVLACAAWNRRFAGQPIKVGVNSRGANYICVRDRQYFVHRVVWALHYSEWPRNQIDHIDGNPSNNLIENLRDVDAVDNSRNKKLPISNRSGAIGVIKTKYGWNAKIGTGGKNISIGYFGNFEDAVAARKKAEAALGYHPNHGRSSFPIVETSFHAGVNAS